MENNNEEEKDPLVDKKDEENKDNQEEYKEERKLCFCFSYKCGIIFIFVLLVVELIFEIVEVSFIF